MSETLEPVPRMAAAVKEGRGINEGCNLERELAAARTEYKVEHAEHLKTVDVAQAAIKRTAQECVEICHKLGYTVGNECEHAITERFLK